MGTERFGQQIRWPMVMASALDANFTVLEDALGARTTNLDEPRPELPLRNGLQLLPIALEIQAPIDMLIIMLGTADCKPLFNVSVDHIREGMQQLVQAARSFKQINDSGVQHIIIIAPPIIDDTTDFGQKVYTGSRQKTIDLVAAYRSLAADLQCGFIDSNDVVTADESEGIHITAESQRALGAYVADYVQMYLSKTTQ